MIDQAGISHRIEEVDAVYFDSVNGVAGTTYPIGTPQMPVDNYTNLNAILSTRAVQKVILLSDFTPDQSFTNVHFIGKKLSRGVVGTFYRPTFDCNGQNLSGCAIENCEAKDNWITGYVTFIDCFLHSGDADCYAAYFIRCEFEEGGGFSAAAAGCPLFHFQDCHFGDNFTIDSKDQARIFIVNCTADGRVNIDNSANKMHHIHLKSGYVYIFASCTTGTFYLYGDFQYVCEASSISIDIYDHRSVHQLNPVRPRPLFIEDWKSESIDSAIWTPTDPAGGTAWSVIARNGLLVARTAPNLNETARLVSVARFLGGPLLLNDVDSIWRTIVLEWTMELDDVANVDNTLAFFGLTDAAGADRSSNNIIGIGLSTDEYQAVADNGGAEYTGGVLTGLTPASRNKFRIDMNDSGITFFANDSPVGFATQWPDGPFYLNFFIDTEAGGSASFYIGAVRWWVDDVLRYSTP